MEVECGNITVLTKKITVVLNNQSNESYSNFIALVIKLQTMKTLHLLSFILYCLVLGCSPQKNSNDKNTLYSIELNPSKSKSIDWRQIFDTSSIEVIPLETKEESLLTWAERFYAKDSMYTFLSDNRIITFKKDGNFAFQISSQGRGQGEYIVTEDFYIDDNQHFFVLDRNGHKIVEYSPGGRFINEIYIGVFGSSFIKINEDLWAIYIGSSSSENSSFRLNYYSIKENKIIKRFKEIKENELNWRHYQDNSNFVQLDKKIFFYYSLNYTIYELTENGIIPYYNLDCGKYQIPDQILEKEYTSVVDFDKNIKNHEYIARIMPIFITNNELYLGFQFENNYLHAFHYGKTTTVIEKYYNFLGITGFTIPTNEAILPVNFQNGFFYYIVESTLIPDHLKKTFSKQHNLPQLDENANPLLLKVKTKAHENKE